MTKMFRGDSYFLSNFSDSFILIDGILYKNAESAYQAHKCVNMSQRRKFAGLSSNDAKALGRKVNVRKDWEDVKYSVMQTVVKEKFKQNLSIRKKLIDTGDEEIVETNLWHDNYWGNCACDKCKNIIGENNLGKMLMEVRDCYQNKTNEGFEF